MNVNISDPSGLTLEEALSELATAPLPAENKEFAGHVLKLSILDWLSVGSAGCAEQCFEVTAI